MLQLFDLLAEEDGLDAAARADALQALRILTDSRAPARPRDRQRVRAARVLAKVAPLTWKAAGPVLQSMAGTYLSGELGLGETSIKSQS